MTTLSITRSIAEELPDWIDDNDLLDRIAFAFATTKQRSINFTADAEQWQGIFEMLIERADVLIDIADSADTHHEQTEARRIRRLTERILEWVEESQPIVLNLPKIEWKKN
jgi:hypothetical protein